jgi:uracil-DNA glycosylase family 4
VENVTDRVHNPFGMCAPETENGAPVEAVYGYGDANADFHVVGDHPGRHGGAGFTAGEDDASGVPFSGAGEPVREVLASVGLSPDAAGSNCFTSYLHMAPTPEGRTPTEREYARMEPFFDAELRAIAAHVLVPVGARAIEHVLREYTAKLGRIDPETAHAEEVRGRGFLVVPVREPAEWEEGDAAALAAVLDDVTAGDYRQRADLGRFSPGSEPYLVR